MFITFFVMEMLEAILLIWRSLRQIKGHGRSIIIEATRMSDANYHYSCNIIEMRTEYGCGLVVGELIIVHPALVDLYLTRIRLMVSNFIV